jgi:hypothetical protein
MPRSKATASKTKSRKSRKAAKSEPRSTFGGYRKRTITAREFIGSLVSLASEAPTIYEIWGKHDAAPIPGMQCCRG